MGFYKLLKVLSRNSGKLGFLGFFSRSVCNTAFATALGSLFQDRHKQTPGGLPEEPRLARGSRESERARESESERERRSASSLSPSPSLSLSLSLFFEGRKKHSRSSRGFISEIFLRFPILFRFEWTLQSRKQHMGVQVDEKTRLPFL